MSDLSPAAAPSTPEGAFARYEAIRSRLPSATFPGQPRHLPTLSEAADHFDGFVLDGFGVLNVGNSPIPGAVARMAELRSRGKRLIVLTNAASYTRSGVVEKYRRLGFDFGPDEVISSRDVAAARLDTVRSGAVWATIGPEGDDFHDIPATCIDAIENPGVLKTADAVLFLSTARWTPPLAEAVERALSDNPRPVVVANPDLVAPREDGLSLEPGLYAHALIDRMDVEAHWFGKPFPEAFDEAAERTGLPRARLAMVGDTLHTDILGGRAAGLGTVLVADHGLFRGRDVAPFIARSGIVPDVIVGTT